MVFQAARVSSALVLESTLALRPNKLFVSGFNEHFFNRVGRLEVFLKLLLHTTVIVKCRRNKNKVFS